MVRLCAVCYRTGRETVVEHNDSVIVTSNRACMAISKWSRTIAKISGGKSAARMMAGKVDCVDSTYASSGEHTSSEVT